MDKEHKIVLNENGPLWSVVKRQKQMDKIEKELGIKKTSKPVKNNKKGK